VRVAAQQNAFGKARRRNRSNRGVFVLRRKRSADHAMFLVYYKAKGRQRGPRMQSNMVNFV
jgi:hypothetical protein